MAKTAEIPGDGVVKLVDQLLAKAVSRQASDVHFEPDEGGMRVRYRLDGLLHDVDHLPSSVAENVIARLKVLAGLLTYRVDIPQEGSFLVGKGVRNLLPERPGGCCAQKVPDPFSDQEPIDVRVATFPTVRGERAAVRFLYAVGQVDDLDSLGLSSAMVKDLRYAAEQPYGLILVTGPAGSGKSTTLYALARHILNTTPGRSVVGLEDPVEQRVAGMAQIQVSPHGELDYLRAMRSLLRQDVQVLLVGEIRDAETALLVAEASVTGHLIMSTLHSGDPAEAIVRLLEMGIAPYQLVAGLSLVCSQRLLRTICPACGGQARAGGGAEKGVRSLLPERPEGCCAQKAPDPFSGCETCGGTGYRGRTACGQVVVMDDELRQAVLNRAPVTELRRLIRQRRDDLAADAARLVSAGRTTDEEVLRILGTENTCDSDKR